MDMFKSLVHKPGLSAVVVGVVLILLVVLGPSALDSFRPAKGYRSALVATLVELIHPDSLPVELFQPDRLPIPRDVLRVEDIINRKVDFAVDFYGFRYRGNTRNEIDAHVYYYGAWEKSELYFIRDTLTSLGRDSVLIDVGANTGTYSIFASKYVRQVHAIEPYPPSLSRLHGMIEENKIGNVVVHPVGLGATEAELPFFPPSENNLGWASFVPGFVPKNKSDQLKLPIVIGDTYFSKAEITRVDFIKMDIEGYEKQALAGLRETLRRYRPVVLMELSIDPALPDLFKSLQELRSAFPENYEILEFAQDDPVSGAYRLRPSFNPSFNQQYQFNIVARPNEKAGSVPMISEGESPNR